jgi:putative glutamine amidotransferase
MGSKKNKPIIGIAIGREGEYLRLKYYYSEAITIAGGLSLLIPYGNAEFSLTEVIDGLLIPGGNDIDPSYFAEKPHLSVRVVPRERTDFEIGAVKAIMKAGKPVFGICYGMQLINIALGGSLYQDIESQYKSAINHLKGYHRIRGNNSIIRGEAIVNTSHHQAIRRLGNHLEICAVSDDELAEAICLSDYPFCLGVQWHPERSDDALSRHLFRRFVEAAYACQ